MCVCGQSLLEECVETSVEKERVYQREMRERGCYNTGSNAANSARAVRLGCCRDSARLRRLPPPLPLR